MVKNVIFAMLHCQNELWTQIIILWADDLNMGYLSGHFWIKSLIASNKVPFWALFLTGFLWAFHPIKPLCSFFFRNVYYWNPFKNVQPCLVIAIIEKKLISESQFNFDQIIDPIITRRQKIYFLYFCDLNDDKLLSIMLVLSLLSKFGLTCVTEIVFLMQSFTSLNNQCNFLNYFFSVDGCI